MGVMLDSLAHTINRTVVEPAKSFRSTKVAENAGLPPPPPNPARTVQQVGGMVLGAINLPVELMNTGFAVATNFISQLLPSFPAATIGCLYVGPPHAHAHPPSLIPPAPPVPLPSLGPIVLGTCVQVLINGMPAARSGDIGTAPTCCGFYPMYEVFLGSSKVFIGGVRAARMGDMCKACMPGGAGLVKGAAAAMEAAGQAVALAGVMADLTEAGQAQDPNMASALAMSAAMGAAQMAADAIALAVMAAMGADPAIPPSPGSES